MDVENKGTRTVFGTKCDSESLLSILMFVCGICPVFCYSPTLALPGENPSRIVRNTSNFMRTWKIKGNEIDYSDLLVGPLGIGICNC